MSERDRRAPGEGRLGPASRAFLRMSEGEAALDSEEASRGRKLVALGLAVLALLTLPLLWLALGPGNDQAVAVVAGKSDDDSSGPGSGDDDDNSGPGGGDDSTGDESSSVTASATSRGNRETGGTTRGEATTQDGTATSKRGNSTRGSTRGEASTRVTTKGTSTGTSRGAGSSTRGTTRGATTN
jgi:hypothetical protein